MTETPDRKKVYLDHFERELARRNLLDFTCYTFPGYEVNWHHREFCRVLNEFIFGDLDRLMIFTQPRAGKSELVSRRLPAFLFGIDPDTQIIACSYSAGLASRMNRDVQRIIDSEKYKNVFPRTTLSAKNIRSVATGSWLRNSDIFEIVGHKGTYVSSGIGGAITGMGAKYALIDDPIKNMAEAKSQTYRDTVWEWYSSTLYTRLEKGGKVLLTLTRWNEDDLAGRLLKQMKNDPDADQWKVAILPAIKEPLPEDLEELNIAHDPRKEGEALWPNKYPIEVLRTIRATSATVWQALYQQTPSPQDGNIVSREWWKYFTARPEELDWVLISWDFAFKGQDDSDYVVGTVWGRHKGRKYLLDMVRDKMSFTETLVSMKALNTKWINKVGRISENLVEEKANGAAIINVLQKDIAGLIPINPKESKEARAISVSPQIESGSVFIPDPDSEPWVSDFIEEWAKFPKGKNDDIVDSTSQALTRLGQQHSWLDLEDIEAQKDRAMSAELINQFWPGAF